MFGQLGEILSGIWDFINSAFVFLIDFIKGIADFAVNLLKLPGVFATVFGNSMVPGIVLAAITACVALLIILRVIGRD